MKKKINLFMMFVMMVLALQIPLQASAGKVSNLKEEQSKNIVDIAMKDGRFKTLTTALKASGLVDTLNGKGEFTVFAPTDEAFSKLPAGTVESLLRPENKDKLTDILTYHVTKGKVPASEVLKLNGKEITMANGKKVTITIKGDSVYLNNSKVIITDIMASNGVIHVIDAVLLPQ